STVTATATVGASSVIATTPATTSLPSIARTASQAATYRPGEHAVNIARSYRNLRVSGDPALDSVQDTIHSEGTVYHLSRSGKLHFPTNLRSQSARRPGTPLASHPAEPKEFRNAFESTSVCRTRHRLHRGSGWWRLPRVQAERGSRPGVGPGPGAAAGSTHTRDDGHGPA